MELNKNAHWNESIELKMPNRKRYRRIMMPPLMEGFIPFGIPERQIEKVILLFEEYEAIRLCDYEKLTQEEAAERMHISRPTFNRLYNHARIRSQKPLSKAG